MTLLIQWGQVGKHKMNTMMCFQCLGQICGFSCIKHTSNMNTQGRVCDSACWTLRPVCCGGWSWELLMSALMQRPVLWPRCSSGTWPGDLWWDTCIIASAVQDHRTNICCVFVESIRAFDSLSTCRAMHTVAVLTVEVTIYICFTRSVLTEKTLDHGHVAALCFRHLEVNTWLRGSSHGEALLLWLLWPLLSGQHAQQEETPEWRATSQSQEGLVWSLQR